MHIHILGICGTFMGGVAQLAVAAGHRVTGCDAHVYPPMSDQLQAAGIKLIEEKTGINTITAEDPMTAVAIGTGKYVEFIAERKDKR